MLRKWSDLPEEFRTDEVKVYYDVLEKKKFSLTVKRVLDIFFSLILLIILSPFFLILAVLIKIDSKGPVFFRQTRVTTYGKEFKIFKFRSMVNNAESKGTQLTVKDDMRITRVGKFIRKCRLDEICQLIDVLRGTMSFVGTRPEVPKYVAKYTSEMYATLLMPAGVTSTASYNFKDENKLLDGADDVDATYINEVLPEKMKYNLEDIKNFSILNDFKIVFKTVIAVFL